MVEIHSAAPTSMHMLEVDDMVSFDDGDEMNIVDLRDLDRDSIHFGGSESLLVQGESTTASAATTSTTPTTPSTLMCVVKQEACSPQEPFIKSESCSPLAVNESLGVFNDTTTVADEMMLMLDGAPSSSSLSSSSSSSSAGDRLGHNANSNYPTHSSVSSSSSFSYAPAVASDYDYDCDNNRPFKSEHLATSSHLPASFGAFGSSSCDSSSSWPMTSVTAASAFAATNQQTLFSAARGSSCSSSSSSPSSCQNSGGGKARTTNSCIRHQNSSSGTALQNTSVNNRFLSPLELRRKRNRESMQRARRRQKEAVVQLKQEVKELELKYQSLCVAPCGSQPRRPLDQPNNNPVTSSSTQSGSTSRSDSGNNSSLRREMDELVECVKALRQENLALRQEIDEQQRIRTSIVETFQEEFGFGINMIGEDSGTTKLWNGTRSRYSGASCDVSGSDSLTLRLPTCCSPNFACVNNSENPRQLASACSLLVRQVDQVFPALPRPSMASSSANTAMVDATGVDRLSQEEAARVVRDSLEELDQLFEMEEFESSGSQVFGWSDKRKTSEDNQAVQYLFEKEMYDVDASKIVDDTWKIFQSVDNWRAVVRDMSTMQALQVINDDMYVCMRERIVPEESTGSGFEKVAKTVFLRFRIKTKRGYVIGRKNISKRDLPASSSSSSNEGCKQEASARDVCEQDDLSLLIEVIPFQDRKSSPDGQPKSGCTFRIGGHLDYTEPTDVHQRLMNTLVLVLSWENMVIGPILKLPLESESSE